MVARPYHLLLSVIPEEDIGGNNEGGTAGRHFPSVLKSSAQIGDHQGKMDTLRRIHLVSSLLLKVLLLLSVCLLLMAALSVLLPWLMAADDEVESSKSAPLPNKRQRIYSGQERPPDEEHRLLNEFLAFEENYSRSFASDEERLWRYLLFVRNMRSLEQRIASEAQKAGEAVTEWGVTEFFDWSDEELAKLVMPPLKGQGSDHDRWWHDVVQKAEPSGYVRPKQWDWRDKGVVTHVKSQQRCGACWAFAVTATVESLHAIRNGTLVILSEQQLIDCDQSNNGCEGGYRPNAFRYIRDNGQLMETAYPYRGVDGNCKLPPGPIDPSQRVFVDQLRSLTSDEEQIADWVAQKGPVTFGMTVTKSMFQYRGGVFAPSPEECAREAVGSHAMEVIGFGETGGQMATPYWIMKNSWGSGWGVNGGYMLMRRGVNSCGLAREVYTALIN